MRFTFVDNLYKKLKCEKYLDFILLGLIAIFLCIMFIGESQVNIFLGKNYQDISLTDCLSYVKGYETDDYQSFKVIEGDPQILLDFTKIRNDAAKVKCVIFELEKDIELPYVQIYYGRDTAELSEQDAEGVPGKYGDKIEVCSAKSVDGFRYLRLDVDKDFILKNIKIAYDYRFNGNIVGLVLLIILGIELIGYCIIRNTRINKNVLYSAVLITLVLISLIPLIRLCKYNHPSADDFSYSFRTYHEWSESHSLLKVLKEAINTSIYYYNNWQGLYSSAFFLALQPSIFGEEYYALTGVLMLFLIGGGNICLFSCTVKKLLGGSILDGAAIGCAASFIMIQWMPSCVEGLYWHNGAVNYGLFYMIMLLLICCIIILHMAQGKKCIGNIIACCLLGFLLEGGNHVTAFMGMIFVFCFILVELYQRKKEKAVYMAIIFTIMVVCFYINISSPGTEVRQAYFNKMNAIECIKNAIITGMKQIDAWIDLSPIVVSMLLMPIYLRLIKKVYTNSSFRFSNPFIVFACSVAWICAMYCPPLYAMGLSGAQRLHNIVYYNFVILFLINVFYCTGWVMCQFARINENNQFQLNIKWYYCAIALIVGLLTSKWDTSWGFKTNESIVSGEANHYSQEAFERYNILLESKGKDVVVSEYSIRPEVLFFDDIGPEPDDWRNEGVRDYYELNSIVTAGY